MTDRTQSLSPRALNRATLHRQLLLERRSMGVLDAIEHLVGLQAQVPGDPYLALWSRLDPFDPTHVSDLLTSRRAVRAALMRSTIHLVSSDDCVVLHPLMQPVLARAFAGNFARNLDGLDLDDVLTSGRALLEQGPRTRAELSRALSEGWPDRDPLSLGVAVTYLVPLVQVPPRGLWGATGQARWSPIQSWLGRDLAVDPSPDDVVLRYLAAFGPASVSDVRTWCGVTRLREVADRLRPELHTFRDDRGRELLDLGDAPRPDPDTPALPRFLPEYDNVLLSHEDRSRFLDAKAVYPDPWPQAGAGGAKGTLLVDGIMRAAWTVSGPASAATVTMTIHPFVKLRAADRTAVSAEGEQLISFLRPTATDYNIRFVPARGA